MRNKRYRYNYEYWYKVVSGNHVITGSVTCKYPLKSGGHISAFQNHVCKHVAKTYGFNIDDVAFADFKFIRKGRVG